MEVLLGGDMSHLLVGIARPGLDTANGIDYALKECKDAWFMHANSGTLYGNGKFESDRAGAFAAGAKLGVLLDLDAGSVLFFKNGAKHGPGWTVGSVTGPVVLAVQMLHTGHGVEVVAGAVRPSGYEESEEQNQARKEAQEKATKEAEDAVSTPSRAILLVS
jgi:hypothetical protein